MYRPVLITLLTCAAALAATSPRPAPMLPAGTPITCRVDQPLNTERDAPGTPFSGQITTDIVRKGTVLVPRGSVCRGHVMEAKSSGRLKGRAVMQLSLDSIQMHGRVYPVSASTAMSSKSHKGHNLKWIGGGAGAGAAIGAIASGGVGALVGAGSGAAVGTGGAALTGKRKVRVPAESQITFTLNRPMPLVR
jgi:hypothetical protein